jgi:hypothetical protein
MDKAQRAHHLTKDMVGRRKCAFARPARLFESIEEDQIRRGVLRWMRLRLFSVIASKAKQSIAPRIEAWIASSLRSSQ